ncbi:alpha/beta hydrolase [Telluria aromaticivorans]|uniref:Alpha/beta hydrolase n=1 Tax=Telluria aromaticivorans TaxID=2725995 RepID=A0A7Y2NY15_9BURK|nr:alpha/beta hydrolase [Telluria aromaticivorans]NNG21598.1 alpha/beta hydrolase [Telluria aromaticivorans]
MPMPVDARMLDDLRRFNRKLALAPRVRYRHRITPLLGQALLRLTQVGADAKLRRKGVRVESRMADADDVQVPLRVLWPAGSPRGVVLDIHGGGWVIGNPEMNDALNAAIVRACDVVVVSVGYRLATEAPIASMIDDCLAALTWLLEDQLRGCAGLPAVVLGESAGAHLAAATLLKLKARPALLRRIQGAVLYYGVFDMAGSPSVRTAGPDTLVLDGPAMLPALRLLTPGLDEAQRRAPPLSPLFGDLNGMPPVLMFTGGRDPLRDDTLGMARRWAEHADVELVDLPEAPHGLIHFPTAMGRAACAHTHAWINARLAQAQGSQALQANAR